ncbi:MAG: hypothetical protein K8T89_11250 [Planctomycetes bacterium]|nr:hypothetical protein [Planctomycetota bacterium]
MNITTLLLTTLFAAAADKEPAKESENFYRAARLGDWIEWKSGSEKSPVIMRHSVIAKSDKELTIRIDQNVDGKAAKAIEYKVDLVGPWPPVMPPNPDLVTKREELGSGTETLTIGDKKYDCKWVKTKSTFISTFQKKETTTVTISKTWTCKDVPLGGSVRAETEINGKVHTTEISGFGRGK